MAPYYTPYGFSNPFYHTVFLHRHYGIFGTCRVIPTRWRIKRRNKLLPKLYKKDNKPLHLGASTFLPFLRLLAMIFLPLLEDIRAKNPLLRLLFLFERCVIFLLVAILFYLQKGEQAPVVYFTKRIIIATNRP